MINRVAAEYSARKAGGEAAAWNSIQVSDGGLPVGQRGGDAGAVVKRAKVSRFSARAAEEASGSATRWVWPRWVAAGRVTLIAGESGLGKSFFSADLAARVSRGAAWPDDAANAASVGTCLVMGHAGLEGHAGQESVTAQRLVAARADLERICSVELEPRDESDDEEASCDDYLAALEEALAETPDCKLVVIDPLAALFENVDDWMSRAVRRMLRSLAQLARKHGVAIVAVADLGLRASLHSVDRMMKSLRTGGAGISTLGIFRDPRDAARRWLISLDGNFAVEQAGLKFQLANVESNAPTLKWGEAGRTSLQKLIGGVRISVAEQEYRDREEYVADKLREILADGPVRRSSFQYINYGSDDRLLRAAKRLRVVKQKFGYNGCWLWMLPEHFPAWQAQQAAKKERAAAERNEQRAKKQREAQRENRGAPEEIKGQGAEQRVAEVAELNRGQGQETFGHGQRHGRETMPQQRRENVPQPMEAVPQRMVTGSPFADGSKIEMPELPQAPESSRPEKKFDRWEKRRKKKLMQQGGGLDQNDERTAGQGELPAQRSGP